MGLCGKIQLIIVVCFTCCISHNIKGQLQPSFESYQIKDGLPSATIYYLKFSKKNLLYLAHSKGLSSYDGGYFRNYYNAYQPNSELTNIMEAPNGTIYAKAFNNVVYQLKHDTLQFAFWANQKSGFTYSCIIGNDVVAIATDSVIFYNTNTQKKRALAFPKPINTWPDKKIVNGYWSYTLQEQLYLILIDENANIYKYEAKDENRLPHMHFCNGEVFGTRTKRLSELTWINKSIQIKNVPPNDARVNYINLIDNNIYINTTSGLYVANNKFEIIKHYNLDDASTTSIVKTVDNNYLISTLENGLLKVPNFNNVQLVKLKSNCNQFAVASNGTILLDTKFKEKGSIESAHVAVDMVAHENQIWLERALHQAEKFGYHFNRKPIAAVSKLAGIKDFTIIPNAILFSTQGGLYMYAEQKNYHWLQDFESSVESQYAPLKKLSLHQEFVPSVKYDEVNDRLVVNTYAGLFEVTKGSKTSRQLPDPINTSVKDIEFWKGKLLLATASNGILIFDDTAYQYQSKLYPTKGYLKHFYKTKNELWVHGEEGIYSFSNAGNKVYNSSHGVPIENVKNIFIGDSILYINHGNSITAVPQHAQEEYTTKPSIIIHAVKQGQQPIQPNASLSYQQNDISIIFSYISYHGVSKHVAYRVNGQSLIHLSNNARSIHIPNLNPDDYTIELFSVENDLINPKALQKIRFSISPPFYKTGLFTLLAVVASLLIAFLIARYVLNNYKRAALHKEAQLLMEKELDKSMLASIKAQMNPHFIFNALNTIQSYIYSNDKQNASVYISKFSDLTRSILDMSNKETVSLEEEVRSLKLYLELEKMRFEDSLNYEIVIGNNISLEAIKIPSMLVQPYIENAIKHGLLHKKTDRKLQLNYSLKDDMLTILIDDNGVGRKRSEELNIIKNKHHQSFAMDANKKRLEILKNNAEDIHFEIIDKISEQGEALGTQVVIRLKV